MPAYQRRRTKTLFRMLCVRVAQMCRDDSREDLASGFWEVIVEHLAKQADLAPVRDHLIQALEGDDLHLECVEALEGHFEAQEALRVMPTAGAVQ